MILKIIELLRFDHFEALEPEVFFGLGGGGLGAGLVEGGEGVE